MSVTPLDSSQQMGAALLPPFLWPLFLDGFIEAEGGADEAGVHRGRCARL